MGGGDGVGLVNNNLSWEFLSWVFCFVLRKLSKMQILI